MTTFSVILWAEMCWVFLLLVGGDFFEVFSEFSRELFLLCLTRVCYGSPRLYFFRTSPSRSTCTRCLSLFPFFPCTLNIDDRPGELLKSYLNNSYLSDYSFFISFSAIIGTNLGDGKKSCVERDNIYYSVVWEFRGM